MFFFFFAGHVETCWEVGVETSLATADMLE
jgi:hypothetical protein